MEDVIKMANSTFRERDMRGVEHITDKNMFFIAILAKNMQHMSLSNVLMRSALDRDIAYNQYMKDRFSEEKIGELVLSVEAWVHDIYGEDQ